MNKRLHVVFFKMLVKEEYAQVSPEYIMESFVEPVVEDHPNWIFEELYIDMRRYGAKYHTDVFASMRHRCELGDVDLIYTESVRKFDCNMERTFESIRTFSSMEHPVGILFETELIYSLNRNGQNALALLEESYRLEKTVKLRKNRIKPDNITKPAFLSATDEDDFTEPEPSLPA